MRELLGERTEEPLGAMGGSSVLAPFDGWRRRPCPYTPEFIRPLLVLNHMSPHALPPEIYVSEPTSASTRIREISVVVLGVGLGRDSLRIGLRRGRASAEWVVAWAC